MPTPKPTPRPPIRATRATSRDAAGLDGVVLVGTSTGGPPALDALLSRLPADFPWPMVIAQHMPATFTGPLARRLDRLCTLSVVEVTRPMPLARGTVYIARGDADIIVTMRSAGPIVMAAPSLTEYRWHPSVDRMVSTAMEHIEAARLVGVLMTGMGNDGAEAMTRLRAAGGRTIAEAEETAVVWGMPGELVRAGGADVVAPLDRITDELMELVGS
jgi:two-component system chemotaxis response regulator CheB